MSTKQSFQVMDPSYESSGDETEAMAKAMGFSSFGTQGPTKKRKFNPKIDAMIEGQELASVDRGGKKGQGSGGNDIPLGKPRLLGIVSERNQEDVGSDEEDDATAYTHRRLSSSSRYGLDEDEGPAYIDTSLPPPNEAARASQEKIDVILVNRIIPPIPPDTKTKTKSQGSETARGVGEFMSSLQDERRPLVPNVLVPDTLARNLGNLHSNRSSPRQRGQGKEPWYVGYYDPSFNENPWAKLEHVNGLESKGTWVERAGQAA